MRYALQVTHYKIAVALHYFLCLNGKHMAINKTKIYLYLIIISVLVVGSTFVYYYSVDKRYRSLMQLTLKTKVDPKSLPEPYLGQYKNKAAVLEFAAQESLNKPRRLKTEEELNNDFKVWYKLGMVRKMLNDYQGAAEAWTKASEIAPDNSAPLANLADLYTFFLKDYDRAEEAYAKAINIFPTIDYYRSFADFYKIAMPNNQERVEQVIQQALQIFPNHPDLVSYLATYFKEKGERDKAITYYEQLLKISPTNTSARADLDKLKSGR